jgi:hypothetical protein
MKVLIFLLSLLISINCDYFLCLMKVKSLVDKYQPHLSYTNPTYVLTNIIYDNVNFQEFNETLTTCGVQLPSIKIDLQQSLKCFSQFQENNDFSLKNIKSFFTQN